MLLPSSIIHLNLYASHSNALPAEPGSMDEEHPSMLQEMIEAYPEPALPNFDTEGQQSGQTGSRQEYEMLYEIEYLIRMLEENGQKLVVVKWKNFGMGECTREPYEYIKSLDQLKGELQRIEEEFEQRKYSPEQIVNINAKTKEFLNAFRTALFPTSEQPPRPKRRDKREPSVEELMRCKVPALEMTARKMELQLNDLTAEDYFYFKRVYHELKGQVKEEVWSGTINRHQKHLQEEGVEVVGVLRCENGFRYCVELPDQLIYTFSETDMRKDFMVIFAEFLGELMDLMEQTMRLEIDLHEKAVDSRQYRLHEVSKARDIIKAKEKQEYSKNPIYYGLTKEQALENCRNEVKRRRAARKDARKNEDQQSQSSKKSNDKKKDQDEVGLRREGEKSVVEDIHAEMYKAMARLGIKRKTERRRHKQWPQIALNLTDPDENQIDGEPQIQFVIESSSDEFEFSDKDIPKKDAKRQKAERKKSSKSKSKSSHANSKSKKSSSSRNQSPKDSQADGNPSRSSQRLRTLRKIHYNREDGEDSSSSPSEHSSASRRISKRQKRT